jgi:hypothetical protein
MDLRVAIHRTWKTGDRVEMTAPMRLSVEAMPDDASMQAFLYGPLVLAGDLGDEGITDDLTHGISGPALRAWPGHPAAPAIEIPAFHAGGANPAGWIKPGDAPQTFHTTGQKRDVKLVPINPLFDRRYSVYWTVG